MIEGKFATVVIAAGADLTGTDVLHKAVELDGTIAAANVSVGLLKTKGNTGENVTVGYAGHMKGFAGAAINSGALLAIAASGWLGAYAGVASGGTLPVGRAITGAASGDLIDGLFNFAASG